MLKNAPITPYIPASDLQRARRFYEEKLGFAPGKPEGDAGITYESGKGTVFFVYKTGFAGTNKASQAFWVVEDLDAEVADLRRRGVVFEEYDMPGMKTKNGIATSPEGKAAWFKDTEGNILAVIQSA